MTGPAWLANAELETAHNVPQDTSLTLAILKAYAPAANRWLDATHVLGNPEALLIADRLAAVWRTFTCDWSQLGHLDALREVHQVGIRLRGLGWNLQERA